MGLPKVTVTAGGAGVAAFTEIEGVALFIGKVTSGDGALQPIGPDTDLVPLFGAADDLVNTIEVARVNGGPRWQAWAIGHTGAQTWEDVVDVALAGCEPEILVVCTPVASGAELTTMQTKAASLLTVYRRAIFLAAFRGIDNTPVTGDADWAAYLAAAQAVTAAVDAARVLIVPLLWGGELGAIAGRLTAEKVARSPARVRSGSAVNPGTKPVDATGAALTLATLEALNTARFSVLLWYEGRQGLYFGDGNTLAPAGGDFPVVEWLRVADKAARRVRQVGIDAIADDTVDNTPAGNAAFGTRLARPLRDMAAEGVREIKPLAKDAITVIWTGVNAVKVAMKIRPLNAPKDITVDITLDTTAA